MANAGWYDDGSGRERWWDGSAWTDVFLDAVDVALGDGDEAEAAVADAAVVEAAVVEAAVAEDVDRRSGDARTVPSFRNFAGDAAHEERMRRLLADGEALVAIVSDGVRLTTVTTRRIVLHESNGNFSAIRIGRIAAIEVTTHGGTEPYLTLHFGDGLSRTLGAPDEEQALAILSALGQP